MYAKRHDEVERTRELVLTEFYGLGRMPEPDLFTAGGRHFVSWEWANTEMWAVPSIFVDEGQGETS